MRTGQILHADDTDVYDVFGRARVGYDGTNSDVAAFTHRDAPTSGLKIDASGNVGVGNVPNSNSQMQVTTAGYQKNVLTAYYGGNNLPISIGVDNSSGDAYLAWNTKQSSGANQAYFVDNFATKLRCTGGQFIFYTAASGTAGNTITFSEKIVIDNNGYAQFKSRFGCNDVTPAAKQTHVADAETSHALNATFSDTEVEGALNALGTKINSILATLETFGFHATS
jgi:hypothetical protein